MTEAYAFYEGAFGQAIVLEAQCNLVSHSHSESQIVFWLGGARAQARVGNEVVQYGENIVLATNAHEAHDMTLLDQESPAVFLVFMISRQWLDARRQATGRPFVFPASCIPIDSDLRQACWEVLNTILITGDARAPIDDAVERLIVATIDASAKAESPGRYPVLPPLLDSRLRMAIGLMRANAKGRASLEEVAHSAGLSRARMFTLFREQLNTTPQVFWSAVRVEEAMRRLIDAGEPLTDVAIDLGFSAPSNFSRFFKGHTGVSPSTFRRAAAGVLPATVTGVRS